MSDLFNKIQPSDYANKGIRTKTNPLSLPASDAQRAFDELSLDVIIPIFNAAIDVLNSLNLGARVSSGDIKGIRINADNVIEVTTDGETWAATGSSGHVIMDENGTQYTQRSRLQFNNVNITDNGTATVIEGIQGIQGIQGETGAQGPQGIQGIAGNDGLSAYQTAVAGGYTGTEADFKAALAVIPSQSRQTAWNNKVDSVNGKTGTAITLTAEDVGALPASAANDISANTSSIATNTSNISTNTSNISTNTSNISSLQTRVSDLESTINSLVNGEEVQY